MLMLVFVVAARQLFFLVSDIVTRAPAVVFGSVALMPMPPTAGKHDTMAPRLAPVAGAGLSNGNPDIVSTRCPSRYNKHKHTCIEMHKHRQQTHTHTYMHRCIDAHIGRRQKREDSGLTSQRRQRPA